MRWHALKCTAKGLGGAKSELLRRWRIAAGSSLGTRNAALYRRDDHFAQGDLRPASAQISLF